MKSFSQCNRKVKDLCSKIQGIPEPSLLLTLFILAFTVRMVVGLGFYYSEGTQAFMDDWDYLNYAREILLGNNLTFNELAPQLTDNTGPGFPVFLVPVLFLFGFSVPALIIWNALIQSLAIVLLFKLSLLLLRNRGMALVVALWAVFYWYHIMYTHRVLKESLLIFLLIAAVYSFFRSFGEIRWKWPLLLASLLVVYLIHTDERYLFYLPLFVLGYLLDTESRLASRFTKMALFLVVTLLLFVPWTFRNYLRYHELIFLNPRAKTSMGIVLGKTHTGSVHGIGSKNLKQIEEKYLKREKTADELKFLAEGNLPYLFGPGKKILESIKNHWRPFRFSGSYAKNGYFFYPAWSTRANILAIVQWGIPLLLATAGSVFAFYRRWNAGIFLFLLVFLNLVIHSGVLIYAKVRYRIPIDAFILILACYGCIKLINRIKSRSVKNV